MNEQLAADSVRVIPACLALVQDGKISAADAARQLYCYTANSQQARSLVPPGSAVDLELLAIEARERQIGFDLERTEQILLSEAINGGKARCVIITSFGRLIVANEKVATPGFSSFPIGLSYFGVASRLVEDLVNLRLMGEHVDPHATGDIIDFSVEIRVGGKDIRLFRWVYGGQSEILPSAVIQLVDHAHKLVDLAESSLRKNDALPGQIPLRNNHDDVGG